MIRTRAASNTHRLHVQMHDIIGELIISKRHGDVALFPLLPDCTESCNPALGPACMHVISHAWVSQSYYSCVALSSDQDNDIGLCGCYRIRRWSGTGVHHQGMHLVLHETARQT